MSRQSMCGVLTVNVWSVFASLQRSNLLMDSIDSQTLALGVWGLDSQEWGVLTVKAWGVLRQSRRGMS
eukprot:1374453-Amorphochlora_amoeboformis.AAC.1